MVCDTFERAHVKFKTLSLDCAKDVLEFQTLCAEYAAKGYAAYVSEAMLHP